MLEEAVKARARSLGPAFSLDNPAALVYESVIALFTSEPLMQGVATAIGEIVEKVDAKVSQMKRFPGRVVRYEGPEALVAVETPEDTELRTVSSAYLKSLGLQDRGAPFVLHELSWAPAVKTEIFVPALDLDEDSEANRKLEERLKAAERPLPWPSAAAAPTP